jgi:hypothetical protein
MTQTKQQVNKLRAYIFRPYRKGLGPIFRLNTWDTGRTKSTGQYLVGYCLKQDGKVLFEGEDFGCSPMHAIDSDECARTLMGFLTLEPGDTDEDYFENYNAAQKTFCDNYAEDLAQEISFRFGDD